ncbi:MAG: MAPEG family protein [Novosphingobium sp.]|nr:MAPEG family protein [Novosphingobium sp.]
MFNAANPVVIFLPMLVVVALTFVALFRMGAARSAAMKGGMTIEYYRAHIGGQEPESAVVGVRHYHNLFEMPVPFYAACLTAFVLGAITIWTLVFAWAYVVGRLVQSAVHLSYNNPMHRGMGFMFGVVSQLALWINVALAVFARL